LAAKTSSFVTEIPLITTSKDLAILAARLEAGRQLYNAVLSEGKNRLQLVRNSELYQQARLIDKNDKKVSPQHFKKLGKLIVLVTTICKPSLIKQLLQVFGLSLTLMLRLFRKYTGPLRAMSKVYPSNLTKNNGNCLNR
jgi:hypothetical protein